MKKVIIIKDFVKSKEEDDRLLKQIIDSLEVNNDIMVKQFDIATSFSKITGEEQFLIYLSDPEFVKQNKGYFKTISSLLRENKISPIILISTTEELGNCSLEIMFHLTTISSYFTGTEWGGKSKICRIIKPSGKIASTKSTNETEVFPWHTTEVAPKSLTNAIVKPALDFILEIFKEQEEKNVSKTNRGFSIFNFKDSYGNMCSIQESSSASEPKIWLGLDEIDAFMNVNNRIVKFTLPESVTANARMHLNQEQVKKLLPILQKFADTGNF